MDFINKLTSNQVAPDAIGFIADGSTDGSGEFHNTLEGAGKLIAYLKSLGIHESQFNTATEYASGLCTVGTANSVGGDVCGEGKHCAIHIYTQPDKVRLVWVSCH